MVLTSHIKVLYFLFEQFIELNPNKKQKQERNTSPYQPPQHAELEEFEKDVFIIVKQNQ